MKPCVYVFGPISGIPDANEPEFREAGSFLMAEFNVDVIIPHDVVGNAADGFTWQECMWKDMAFVAARQPFAFAGLPGWRASRGGRAEFLWALGIDLPVWVLWRGQYGGYAGATDIGTGARITRYRTPDISGRRPDPVSVATPPGSP